MAKVLPLRNKMKKFLQEFGIDVALMIAGMFGSLLMVSKKSTFNAKASIIGIVSGTLSANYLTQLVVDLFELTGKSQYGIAFLLGYFGLKGVEKLFEVYQKKHNI